MHNATDDAAALSDPFSRTLLPASFVVALVLSVVALLLAGYPERPGRHHQLPHVPGNVVRNRREAFRAEAEVPDRAQGEGEAEAVGGRAPRRYARPVGAR
jgi:hypothetical protein